MAYKSNNLSALAYANGFTLWHYKTPDRTIEADGYFDAATTMLRVGDFVMVSLNTGETVKSDMLVVTRNTGTDVQTRSMFRSAV